MANGKDNAPALVALNDFHKSSGAKPVHMPGGPSLTRQEFAEECDINLLMKRYEGHVVGGPGNLPPVGVPQYIDFTEIPSDLLSYMAKMQEAEAAFMSLPALVRKEFDNSAHAFVDFASDPENLPQLRTWGLAPPAPASPPAGGAPPGAPASAPGGAMPPSEPASPAGS